MPDVGGNGQQSNRDHVAGHPAYYRLPCSLQQSSSDLGGFREMYEPGCFTESIAEDDIYALHNHHASRVLGRTTAGTIEVFEDAKGVQFDYQSIERGDIEGYVRRVLHH